jgi:hypothetical protein
MHLRYAGAMSATTSPFRATRPSSTNPATAR